MKLKLVSRKRILNIEVDDLSMEQFLRAFTSGALVTPNTDHLLLLQESESFLRAYRAAEFVTVDSQILKWSMRLIGAPVQSKLSGSDILPAFCEHHRDDPSMRLFLLGGREGVARAAMERINNRLGRQVVIAAHSPSMRFGTDEHETSAVIEMVNASGATALAVGLGAPKQELWIHANRVRMPGVRWFLAVGAALDFEAGSVKRAPGWVSQIGLEWLYRLSQDPRRLWRRYLVRGPRFFVLLLRQRAGVYRSPFPSGELG